MEKTINQRTNRLINLINGLETYDRDIVKSLIIRGVDFNTRKCDLFHYAICYRKFDIAAMIMQRTGKFVESSMYTFCSTSPFEEYKSIVNDLDYNDVRHALDTLIYMAGPLVDYQLQSYGECHINTMDVSKKFDYARSRMRYLESKTQSSSSD